MAEQTPQKRSAALLIILAAVVALVFALFPRLPQPQAYHSFADQRSALGVHNFGDVASNLPFAVVGLWGLAFLFRPNPDKLSERFVDRREQWPYLLAFIGLLLTAFGSTYYHLLPNNTRLVWDRLPMTIVFMSMVAAVVVERVSVRAGMWLLPIFLLLGAVSVVQWYMSELSGHGDLRLYAAVQVYSALALLIALVLPPRYTRSTYLAVVVGFYALAKALELLDKPIFNAGHFVSGHTVKHLAAAGAGYWILRMLQKRKPILMPTSLPVVAVSK